MATRFVTMVCRDHGTIAKICHPGEPWSPCDKATAIREIASHRNQYRVTFGDVMAEIRVIHGKYGDYLRTRADGLPGDNLRSLPECGTRSSAPKMH